MQLEGMTALTTPQIEEIPQLQIIPTAEKSDSSFGIPLAREI
jgi:hypothetical protein